MFNFSRINCVLAKQSCPNQTLRLFSNVAKTNFRRNYKTGKLTSSTAGIHNRCRCTESVASLNQSIFRLCSEKNNFISIRNFSTSNTARSWMQSNQDKEKVKNYIFFGTVLASVIFVFYMSRTMEYHQDFVLVEPSEPSEKKK